ncbi:MAG TPA: hypothetical protein VMU22_12035 [Rhizomicrobium sp.]|nr:hypothetical protein [Rhizomicrobium sp.]
MSPQTTFDAARKRSVLHELFELLLTGMHKEGAAKNEWLMPFDPAPSSFRRKSASRSPRRRRPF